MLEEIITYPDYEKARAMASTFSFILESGWNFFQLTFILLNRCKKLSWTMKLEFQNRCVLSDDWR